MTNDKYSRRILTSCIRVMLVVVSVLLSLYWGSRKEGYHVDELYSYGLSNSEYLPFMHFGVMEYSVSDWMKDYGPGDSLSDLFTNVVKDFRILKDASFNFKNTPIYTDYLIARENSYDTYTTTWVSGQDYLYYLTPSPENRFNYASVYYNQRGDVHPPLFYILLHTICSFAPGYFSRYFGIGLNACIMGLTLYVLYGIVKKYFGGDLNAICVCVLWGWSEFFVETAIFIRMYSLLTLMTVLFFGVHMRFRESDFEWNKKIRRLFFVTALFGYLTHYYFIVFAGLTALTTFLYLMFSKKFRTAFRYMLNFVIAGIVGLIVWPFSVKHVFFGYRGVSSFTTHNFHDAFEKTYVIFRIIITELFLNHMQLACVTAGLVLFSLMLVILKKKKIPAYKTLLIVIPVILYICIVSQIIPMFISRYFVCLYPLIMIFVVSAISKACGALSSKKRSFIASIPLVVLSAGLFFVTNGFFHMPNGLYIGGIETVTVPEKTDIVYVLANATWNEANNDLLTLSKARRVGIAYESEIEALSDYTYDEGTVVMLCVRNGVERGEVIARVKEALGITDFVIIEERAQGDFLRVYMTKLEEIGRKQ